MFLSDASTRRPVAISCLLIALVALGLNAYRKISLELLPQMDIPYVTVSTTWLGATPSDIEKDIAKRIEDAVAGVDGLKHIDTSCMENLCYISLEFNLDVDVDTAAVDVREKIDTVIDDLPTDADRPIIQKIDINATAVANVFLTGSADVDDMYDYADNELGDQFAALGGVSEVTLVGGNEREVHVEIDREKLAEANLTTGQLVEKLQAEILNLPSGRVREKGMEFSVRFDAEYDAVEDIASLEVANNNGQRITLADLGRVFMSTEEVRQRATLNGKPGVLLKIVKKSEANTVKVVKLIRERFEELSQEMPEGMEMVWVSDDASIVSSMVQGGMSDIISSIVLCAIILILFLANIRTAVVAGVAMPLTVIISLFFIFLTRNSLNTATLLALGLSTGVLVSNSIVVLQSIVKRFPDFDSPWEAARVGTADVAVAVLASAGTNVVVMIPISMMSSIVGLFFRPFAVTTLIINLASIFISFTLTPILCALFMKKKDSGLSKAFENLVVGIQQGLAEMYANFVEFLSRSKILTVVIVLVCLVLLLQSLSLVNKIGFIFTEELDLARVCVKVEYPTYYNLEKTTERITAIEKKLSGLSDMDYSMVTIGKVDGDIKQATEGVFLGQIQLFFKDKTQRKWSLFDRLDEIRELVKDETDCIITISILNAMGNQQLPLNIIVMGTDLEQLDKIGLRAQEVLDVDPNITTTDTSVRDGKEEIKITPKRAIMSDYGLTAQELGYCLLANIDGIKAADFRKGDRTYHIRVKYSEIPGKNQAKDFTIPAGGKIVMLETVADIQDSYQPSKVYRREKTRGVSIIADLAQGGSLSKAIDNVKATLKKEQLLPPGYRTEVSGSSEYMGEAVADFVEAAIMAVFLTFLTLAAILESFTSPIYILTTLPLGLVGVMWSLFITGHQVSIFVLLGVVTLIGVVVNAAVLFIDCANQAAAGGLSKREAMIFALKDQFTPVMMVTCASAIGMLPMALAKGIAAELRVSIGIISVGGVTFSGIVMMFVLPMVYLLFASDKKKSV